MINKPFNNWNFLKYKTKFKAVDKQIKHLYKQNTIAFSDCIQGWMSYGRNKDRLFCRVCKTDFKSMTCLHVLDKNFTSVLGPKKLFWVLECYNCGKKYLINEEQAYSNKYGGVLQYYALEINKR